MSKQYTMPDIKYNDMIVLLYERLNFYNYIPGNSF